MATAEEFFLWSVAISFFLLLYNGFSFFFCNRLHKILRNNTIYLYQ